MPSLWANSLMGQLCQLFGWVGIQRSMTRSYMGVHFHREIPNQWVWVQVLVYCPSSRESLTGPLFWYTPMSLKYIIQEWTSLGCESPFKHAASCHPYPPCQQRIPVKFHLGSSESIDIRCHHSGMVQLGFRVGVQQFTPKKGCQAYFWTTLTTLDTSYIHCANMCKHNPELHHLVSHVKLALGSKPQPRDRSWKQWQPCDFRETLYKKWNSASVPHTPANCAAPWSRRSGT